MKNKGFDVTVDCARILLLALIVTVDEADLDVLPQEPIDEDDIIGLRWEDIAHASTGIYCL